MSDASEQTPKTILIVDDEPAIVKVVKIYLEREGYKVLSAGDGEEGLRIARGSKPDLILLDMHMPKKSGLEFYYEILTKDKKPEFPVLVLTARSEFRDLFKSMSVDGFVSKPFDLDELLREIKIILDRAVLGSSADGMSVLLAEDNLESLKRLATAFRQEGYSLCHVQTGLDLLEAAYKNPPDLVVVKWALPDMAGDEVVSKLKSMPKTLGIPVLLFAPKSLELDYITIKILCDEIEINLQDFVRTDEPEAILKACRRILRKPV